MELNELPGAELVLPGLTDLQQGRNNTIDSLLISIASIRLTAAGLDIPKTLLASEPELTLYAQLQAQEILPMERQRLVNCLVSLITGQQKINEDKYAAIKNKSSRRKCSSSGTFEQEYDEPKHLRSIRVTDTAWENLDVMAQKNNLTRTELIEKLARGLSIQ